MASVHTNDADLQVPKGRGRPRGRKDAEKQVKAIESQIVRDEIGRLVKLHKAAHEATEDLGNAIKLVAEKSGYLATAIKKFVTIRAGENFEEKKTAAEQLVLLLDEVGE